MSDAYRIRPFETMDDYRACVALQEETWGHGFSERVPTAILKVSQILGGVSAGAYDEAGGLAGFVFGMTGLRNEELVHWSDMLAVRDQARDAGLGRRLKAYQREQVMARGVSTMYWTFDPLQARNAHLNFNHLGIVVREYVEDMYGETDSPLHMGIGTDRFIALWLLESDRVKERLEHGRTGDATDAGTIVLDARTTGRHPVPLPPDLDRSDGRVGVRVPTDIASLMDDDPALALAWRHATREVLTHYLSAGFEVRELERGDHVCTYVLAPVPT